MSDTAVRPRRRARPRLSRQQQRRRSILRAGLLSAGLLALTPLAFLPVARRLRDRLRPPGAMADEATFLGACIKCGQCVQVCPVNAILLADAGDGFGHGAPYIEPREQACDFSCDALSCILACPTGALRHEISLVSEVAIGTAELVRPDACRARRAEGVHGPARTEGFRGRLRYSEIDRWTPQPVADQAYDLEHCDLCARLCPVGDTAIAMVRLADGPSGATTPEVRDGCVGCGVCEMVCPETPTCITVVPTVALAATHEGAA